MTFQLEEELRSKDKKLKEKDALLCTLQSQDGNAVMLAKKNQTQKAELRKRVTLFFKELFFLLMMLFSSEGDNSVTRQRDCNPEGINAARVRE